MDRLQSMRVLVKVADTGSFAQAARLLNMSPPAVTRAVAYLEDLTGARLFLRSTRSVKLTAPGSRYVEDCRRILAEIEEAEASAGGSHATPSGLLTVTAPVLFGQLYVMPILTSFLTLHPAVNGRALLLDRVVNLLEEGIDVAPSHRATAGLRLSCDPGRQCAAGDLWRALLFREPFCSGRPSRPCRTHDYCQYRVVRAAGLAVLGWRESQRHAASPAVLQHRRCLDLRSTEWLGSDQCAVLSGCAGGAGDS